MRKTSRRKTIAQLVDGLDLVSKKGNLDQDVRALITDSRRVVPGSLFFARRGLRTDGRLFIEEAIDRGACGIISDGPPGLHDKIAFLQVESVSAALAAVSGNFYDWPDRQLHTVGVTGTNGKTTVSWLIQNMLKATGMKCGLIGTILYDLGERTVPSYKTTPESVDTFSLMTQMQSAGCSSVVMEVSSHGIDQGRVDGLHFQTAVFLNLTQDHLDYHQDMEAYFQVKKKLFCGGVGPSPTLSVVNKDDPYGRRIIEEKSDGKVVTFGFAEDADYRAENALCTRTSVSFDFVYGKSRIKVEAPLAGRFNIANLLAALAVVAESGVDVKKAIRSLKKFHGVPGRLERVDEGQACEVFVDYAHTDDALRSTLEVLREITPGKIHLVFGCGGDRDRGKRPLMMHVGQTFADFCWVTADNPRTEDLYQIFNDMKKGVSKADRVEFVEDRRLAISLALDEAEPEDTILIAGKGHEPFLEYADTIIPFDDRQVTAELINIKKLKVET